jgi:hypothetical protein
MQPYHAIDDGRWAEAYSGDRIRTTYVFRSLLISGAMLAFGSDWFVASPTPLEGIYAAVTRRTLADRNSEGTVPDQKITVEEAVRAYTAGAAFAGFDDQNRGVLSAGPARRLRDAGPEHLRNAGRRERERASHGDGGRRAQGLRTVRRTAVTRRYQQPATAQRAGCRRGNGRRRPARLAPAYSGADGVRRSCHESPLPLVVCRSHCDRRRRCLSSDPG